MTDRNDVGYGRPPTHSRWTKGQSGNPRGRPKSSREIVADAAAILAEPVSATTPGGRRVSLDAIEASYLALCKKALKGHKPSLLAAIKIMLEVSVAWEEERLMDEERRQALEEARHRLTKPVDFDHGD